MFRSSVSFLIIACIISVVFMIPAIISPEMNRMIAPYLVVASVFLIGIPHGAIDHIISAELFDTDKSIKGHIYFYSTYLLIMLMVGLLWVWTPIVGMMLFLLISVYHFGQADMEDYLITGKKNHLDYLIRGLFIIGMILFSDTNVSLPIISQATDTDLAVLDFTPQSDWLLFFLIATMYLIYSMFLTLKKEIRKPINFFGDFILILLLFAICGPLTGFAIYFAVWHSAGHIYEMQQFFKRRKKKLTIANFYKLSLPFTFLSVFGLLILYALNNLSAMEDKLLILMFIVISVLTLPHMFIVDKLYSERV